jgi:hypothetical protein
VTIASIEILGISRQLPSNTQPWLAGKFPYNLYYNYGFKGKIIELFLVAFPANDV